MLSLGASVEGLRDAVPDALGVADSRGLIRFVNRQTEMVFGHDRDAMSGLPLEVRVPESARATHPVRDDDPLVIAAVPEVTERVQGERETAGRQARGRARLGELGGFQQMTTVGALKRTELQNKIESLRGSGTTERGEPDDQC
jgi:PAS domain-containing protein